jgi:hypothetical protein
MRMINRVDVLQQLARYMWVLPAESPLGLGTLYVRNPFERKGKVQIPSNSSGNLSPSVLGLCARVANKALLERVGKSER